MYVDRVPNRNSPPCVLLRSSRRVGQKTVKETHANLSKLPPELVDQIRVLLKGGTAVRNIEEAFEVVDSRPHGHVAAVLGIMRKLDFPRLIDPKNSRLRRLVMGLIAARVLKADSKLATSTVLDAPNAPHTLNEELGLKRVDADDLYAAMDYLVARKGAIERRLAQKHLTAMVLCDVTSSYVEGDNNELAAFGYNRDKKRGKMQIVFGLLTDEAGCPVAVEVFKGNTGDPTTVASQVQKLQQDFGLRQVTVVGDRGLLTNARIRKDLKPLGLGWLTAMRRSEISKLVEPKGLQLDLFDETGLVEIESDAYPNERLILCRNPLRAKLSTEKRQKLLARTEDELKKVVKAVSRKKNPLRGAGAIGERVGRWLGRWKMRKFFDIEITDDHFSFARKEADIRKAETLDGVYAIRTTLDKQPTAAEIVAHYKRLAAVETAFRSLKSVSLKVRPIHHRRESRVIGHVFLCMLAYYVEYHLRKALAPMLWAEEDPEGKKAERNSAIEPAKRSEQTKKKIRTRRTTEGQTPRKFPQLMENLAALCRSTIRPKITLQKEYQITMLPPLTPIQKQAFKLLKISVT